MRRIPLHLTILLGIAFITLFLRLGALPLTGADEPRYARVAEEMRGGGGWVTPTLQGEPWLEKPPLYYWLAQPFYAAFDSPEVAARAGSAVCALATALAVYWAGCALWTPTAGFVGAAMLLSTLGVAGFGRSATTDMPFTCFLTLALATLAVATEKDVGWGVLAAYVPLGLAVLGKGPVAVVLALGVGVVCWLLDETGDGGRGGVLRRWRPLLGLPLAALVALPWFWLAFRENGYAFVATFFINHNLARYATGVHHHAQPFYYYLPVMFALAFPWSGWLPVFCPQSLQAVKDGLRRWRAWRPATVFVAAWLLFPVAFFSLSGSKLPGYVLPSLPPLALLVGARLGRAAGGCRPLPRLRAALWLHLALSLGMAVAAPVFFQKDYGGRVGVGLGIAAAALTPALAAFAFGRRGNLPAAVWATVVQGTALVAAVALFAFPALGERHSTRAIARQALAERTAGEPVAMYRAFHHTFPYYTGYLAETRLDDEGALRRFAAEHPSFLVLTKEAGARELEGAGGFSTRRLCRQGGFLLLRVAGRGGRAAAD
ncbi:MAG: glycosyltransferase family 39 protein [Acidobacteriota bacterium]|nr:glycosyltransferase family 39 protein [Acidobacteriota bacterium]